MRRLTLLIALASLLALASCSRRESSSGPAVALGRNGTNVTVAAEPGKVTLLHFWATWCGPCRYELPSFVAFAKANAGPRLRWVAVANDPTFGEVDEHLRSTGITMDTLLDPRGDVMRKWQVDSIPTTIVLDGDGRELARYIGAHDWSDPKQRDAVLAFAR